ncbi:MAG: hypothetical protein ABDH21_00125 [bacterium]
MKNRLSIVKILAVCVLVVILVLQIMNYTKSLNQVNYQIKLYSQYLSMLSLNQQGSDTNTRVLVDSKYVREKFSNFITYLDEVGIANIVNLINIGKEDDLQIRIKRDYFLNFLGYMNDNSKSFKIKDMSMLSVDDQYVNFRIVVSYLYSLPDVDFTQYFVTPQKLKIRFWDQELQLLQSKQISQNIDQQNQQNQQFQQPPPYQQNQQIYQEEFNIDLKYKGRLVLSDKIFAIIEYEGNEAFVPEGGIHKIKNFEIKIIKVENNYLRIQVHDKFYDYKIEQL